MQNLLIVTAATKSSVKPFAKGQRVVVRIKKNEWYIGTVTRAGVKLGLVFDDGATATVEPEDFRHVRSMTKPKKLKRALDDAEVVALTRTDKPVKVEKSADVDADTSTKKKGKVKTELIRLTHNRGKIVNFPSSAALLKLTQTVFPRAEKPAASINREVTAIARVNDPLVRVVVLLVAHSTLCIRILAGLAPEISDFIRRNLPSGDFAKMGVSEYTKDKFLAVLNEAKTRKALLETPPRKGTE